MVFDNWETFAPLLLQLQEESDIHLNYRGNIRNLHCNEYYAFSDLGKLNKKHDLSLPINMCLTKFVLRD